MPVLRVRGCELRARQLLGPSSLRRRGAVMANFTCAKSEGTCGRCKGPVLVGQWYFWSNANKARYHERDGAGCVAEDRRFTRPAGNAAEGEGEGETITRPTPAPSNDAMAVL